MLLRHTYLPILIAAALTLLAACARPGTPDGGPFDEEPPVFLGATPADGATSVSSNTIALEFNEFIRLDNATEKVVISPPQLDMPEITAVGRKIKVKLIDSLKANTTYTIDFGDAIVDNNEGNPMGKFTYTFSTGDTIASMEISGRVLNAYNLEPIKGILVGLHSDTTAAAFNTKPFDRMARTNGSGQFTIKGVAPSHYRIYALQDADGDYRFNQKSEMLAFSRADIHPESFPDQRADTVWRDSTHYDSIKIVPYTHYLPDNLVLLAFSESTLDRHLLKSERRVPEHFELYFTGPSEQRPTIRGLNFDESKLICVASPKNDTLTYWISDTALVHTDSLFAEVTYLENDSAGAWVSHTEEMDFISRLPRSRQIKMEQEKYNTWFKAQEKLRKKGKPYQSEMPPGQLEIGTTGNGTLDPYNNIQFTSPEPLASIDTTKFHLYLKQDTLYVPADHLLEPHPSNAMRCTLYGEWRPEQQYLLKVDSAAFTSIYGKVSDKIEFRFNIPSLDQYCTFTATIQGRSDSTVIVQLLNNNDTPVRTERTQEGRANFYFVKPGAYYMRAFIDSNGNGQWDEGNYADDRQAEEVYYYPGQLYLRAKWDIDQAWNLTATPRERQKPADITKQKPDRKKSILRRNEERARMWNQK